MADVTIKNVPDGCEESVKEMAMVAIERFLRRDVKVAEAVEQKFKDDVDAILTANSMSTKYTVKKEESLEPSN